MPPLYSPAARALQDQFDTRHLADRLEDVTVHDRFTPDDRRFLERLDMFFLATADAAGQPTCSYKGGDPGFVTVVDDRTLAFPNYDGNGRYLSMGNVDANCPRYIHKYQLVERSPFVPHVGTATPIPGWKHSDWARDVLPAGDPARASR